MVKCLIAIAIVAAVLCLAVVFRNKTHFLGIKNIPFVGRGVWSIGIYTGNSPFELVPCKKIKNPVLTARSITDIPARLVADPFMVKKNFTWYMFFEIMNSRTRRGDIGLASSADGFNWVYKQIVLDEPFHLSYPYVFEWEGEFYMIPETYKTDSVRLYKASDFPAKWSFVGTLLEGKDYVDSSVFRFRDKWWMFTSTLQSDTLYLYHSDKLVGPWSPHPKSPIVKGNRNIARPGGRVLILNGHVFRFAQDDAPVYGNQVRAFEITRLTAADYEEEETKGSPALKASKTGWNADGMHHIDAHPTGEGRWIACVDGYRDVLLFGPRY